MAKKKASRPFVSMGAAARKGKENERADGERISAGEGEEKSQMGDGRWRRVEEEEDRKEKAQMNDA